tara:strand:+ start:1795 stop:1944 length:150 start_codon:yes stop_codon:yes gene_type:complete
MDFFIGFLLISIAAFALIWKYKPEWIDSLKSYLPEILSFQKKDKKKSKK